MSKKINEEVNINDKNNSLSKKEIYDLEKRKRLAEKEKKDNLNKKKGKKNSTKQKKQTHQTNLAGRIFAIIMLILMVGSVLATISYYFAK